MLPQLIALAVTAGVAKKAWDRYHTPKRRLPDDITNLVGRPEAVGTPPRKRKAAEPARRREAPSA